MNEYEMNALEFLKKAETKMTISRIGEVRGFPGTDDVNWRYKYQVTMTRHGKQYRFTFYDSHNNWRENKRPSRYSVLACVEKYPIPESLEDFMSEYGYPVCDAKRVGRIHQACKKQYGRLLDLFGEELMKDLREID